MSVTSDMLRSAPGEHPLDTDALAAAIDACLQCAQTCSACATACLGEEDVASLRGCIRTDLDCADLCVTTARVLSRTTATDVEIVRGLVQACVTACERCGLECARHAEHHEHCRICAEACRRCAQACRDLLESIR